VVTPVRKPLIECRFMALLLLASLAVNAWLLFIR